MEIHHLRHFLAVADAGSMTRAAEQLGLAQPALSQSIRRLEGKLGVRLFNRSRRGITLNPVGQAILDDVRASVIGVDAVATRAHQVAQGLAGTLTIGFVASAVYDVLPHALRRFKPLGPDVRIVLKEMGNAQQVSALEKGDIDIGVLYTPMPLGSRLRQQVLTYDRLVAAIHDGIATDATGCVSLHQVAREGLVMFHQVEVPLMRAGILKAMSSIDEEYTVVQEVGRTLTALACVAAGIGVALLPSSTRRVHYDGVKYCEVVERDLLPQLELSAVWPARSRPGLADRFAQALARP